MWPGCPSLSASTAAAPATRDVGAGEDERGIEVALDDRVGAQPTASAGDRGAPVEPDHLRAGGVHRLEQVVAADAEVDRRGARMARRQGSEDLRRVRRDEPLVVRTAERAGP